MKPISTNDFTARSTFTGQCYGTRVTIEVDHSDLSIDELFDAFKGVALGLGFSENTWNEYIRETGYDLQLDLEQSEINLPHSNEHWNEEKSTFDWDSDYFTMRDQLVDPNAYIIDEGDTLEFKNTGDLNMTDNDANVFIESITNPSEPNEVLKEAAEKYKNGIQ